MRYVIPLLLLLFIPCKSEGAVALVPGHVCSNGDATSGLTQSCTLTGLAAHNHVILNFVSTAAACDNELISDTASIISGGTNQTAHKCLWVGGATFVTFTQYCVDTQTYSGNDTFSVAGGAPAFITAAEYSGMKNIGTSACGMDGSDGGLTAGSPSVPDNGPVATGTITTTDSGDLVVAAGMAFVTGTVTLTVPSGYTQENYIVNQTHYGVMSAYKVPGATGTFTPTFAIGGVPSANWIGLQVAYLPSPAVASAPTQIGATLTGP